MPDSHAGILIVDDDRSIRTAMSQTLGEMGYGVRVAEDGLAALLQIQQEIPSILISDLNMPRMSGFELLSKVRRCFPAIQSIAMSGSFSGDEVPSGVAADAFYQKGSSIAALLRIIETLPHMERCACRTTGSDAVPSQYAETGAVQASRRQRSQPRKADILDSHFCCAMPQLKEWPVSSRAAQAGAR
jgi:DNA-binding NtrC family response regulator